MNNVHFIEAVMLRPTMYTMGGSFEEVVAFLEGFYSGMGKSNPSCQPVQEWLDFKSWIAAQLNVNKTNVFLQMNQGDTRLSMNKLSELVSAYFSE